MATSGGTGASWEYLGAQRISSRRRGKGLRAAVANAFLGTFLAGAAAGCSTVVDSYLVDPSHYSAYHCKQLVARLKEIQTHQTDLRNLMDKASEGGGGTVIGAMAYRADYANSVGEEKVLRRTAADKKCSLEGPTFESDQIIR
jgi:hypothetical protein